MRRRDAMRHRQPPHVAGRLADFRHSRRAGGRGLCSPFSITGTFGAFGAQAHYIALQGQASSASAYVSGASLSAILHPCRIGR